MLHGTVPTERRVALFRIFHYNALDMAGAVVTGIVFSLPNALPACFFAALVPALWIPLVKAWRNAGAVLGIGLSAWKLPFVMMGRWRRSLNYGLRCGRTSRRNYTWLQK